MTDPRSIAYDVTFTILYIGLFAAMTALSLLLIGLGAFGVEFGPLERAAIMGNIAGWLALPLAPRLYGRLVGHPFSWRVNSALGG